MPEELTPAAGQAASLDEWKRDLRAEFERWLASVDEIDEIDEIDGADEIDDSETPDLYSFYEQLAAVTTEARRSNRRTAEAFSQWSETLSRFDAELRVLHEQLARQPVADDALPRSWCLALVEITDRMHRLATAFSRTPARAWLGTDGRWRAAWEMQRQGHDILMSHTDALVAKAGVTRIESLHRPFDPAEMSAVVAEPNAKWPHNTVIEEIAPGYRLRGELLRVAQVKVSSGTNP